MGKLERRPVYNELLKIYKTSEQYERSMALGMDINSVYPQEIKIEVPKNNWLYKDIGIRYAILYLGKWKTKIGNGSEIIEKKTNKLYIDLRGLRDYGLSNEQFEIYVNWRGPKLPESNTLRHLNYFRNTVLNVDLSKEEYGFNWSKITDINNYLCLESIIRSNAKVLSEGVQLNFNLYSETEKDLYKYIDLSASLDFKKYFSSKLLKRNNMLIFRIPVTSMEMEWSLNYINLLKKLILRYISKIENKPVSERYFKHAYILMEDLSFPRGTVVLDSLIPCDDYIPFDIHKYIDDEFLDMVWKKAGLKMTIG